MALNRQFWGNHAEINARSSWHLAEADRDRAHVEAQWAQHCGVWLSDGAGLHLHIGARLCEFHPAGVRWRWVLAEPAAFAAVRRVVNILARILGSPCAIYLPDSAYGLASAPALVDKGAALDAFLGRLRDQHGPGAPALRQILREEAGTWTAKGYYVDWLDAPEPHARATVLA